MKILIIYLCIINFIAFIVYGVDKSKARNHQWRISENMLMFLALIGGGIGALAGMQLFRHKTKHIKFVLGVPFCIIIWVVLIAQWYMKTY